MIVVADTSVILNLALGLTPVGVLGILVRAKRHGQLAAVAPVRAHAHAKRGDGGAHQACARQCGRLKIGVHRDSRAVGS